MDAEANRLLYVAATRAGTKLVISQRDGKANQKNPWQLFDDYLQSVGQFADPGPLPSKPTAKVTINRADWKDEVDVIEQRWRAVLQPTYAVQAIKESTIKVGPKPHGAEKGGAEWGEAEALPITLVDDVVTTVERVITSKSWQRAQNSQHCLTEVPLALPVAASEASSGLPTVLRGVIDLVFQESVGWVIVDY